jgi:hypothetical protein
VGAQGIRCGFAISTPELVAVMSKVKAPYNVNKLTSKVAQEAYSNLPLLAEAVQKVLAERTKLEAALKALPYVRRVIPSDANFLMFAVDNAPIVYKRMADAGVVIRDRSTQRHCEDCLRVTVGTPEENAAFLALLETTVDELRPKCLRAAVQQYAWGLSHDKSLVSDLGNCNCCSFNTFLLPKKGGAAPAPPPAVVGDTSKPFAELWMGTRPPPAPRPPLPFPSPPGRPPGAEVGGGGDGQTRTGRR